MTRSRNSELMGSHRRGWTAGVAVFAFAAVAVLATACGGGGSGKAGGTSNAVAHLGTTTPVAHTNTSGAGAAAGAGTAANGGPAETNAMKFTSCMRSHGVPNFPEPLITSNGQGNVSVQFSSPPGVKKGSPQMRHALEGCHKYLTAGTSTSENITVAEEGAYVKAAQCMRAHGINGFPDPTFTNGNVSFNLPQNVNPNTPDLSPTNPQFERARHICQNLIPNGEPYSATDENP